MKTRWIGAAAAALVILAGSAWAGTEAQGGYPDGKRAAKLAASARAALGKGDAVKAVQDAEAATLLLPADAATRVLLGRAYLAAGRFRSAETAFGDALSLDPSLHRVAVNRALAQIALGQATAARASLAKAQGLASGADIGLALALLGDVDDARTRLNAAARAAGADAHARQNLGLAYALEGRWTDAVAVAQQDVPPDLMPQRLRRWAMIAQLKADPAMQVGAILGVLPASDPGRPVALALAVPPPVQAIPIVLAATPPSPPPFVALVAPVVREEHGPVVSQAPIMPAAPALVPTPLAMHPKPAAWTGPLRTRIAAAAPKSISLVSQISLAPARSGMAGNWAVQLGAFSSAERTEVAWSRLSGKAAFLNAYTPTGSERRWGKAMLYRLSVSGLLSRQEAISLCLRVRTSGGHCFVRNAGGDQPMIWALRNRTDTPA